MDVQDRDHDADDDGEDDDEGYQVRSVRPGPLFLLSPSMPESELFKTLQHTIYPVFLILLFLLRLYKHLMINHLGRKSSCLLLPSLSLPSKLWLAPT